jgi:hypothetical protein
LFWPQAGTEHAGSERAAEEAGLAN